MTGFLHRVRSRVGDFWWWSLCLFLVLRVGDVFNAVVGLWLVPKYVGQDQLGAVLPLLQVANVFGLPISILVITFSKFLNQYYMKGEYGKVKSLIRTFWGGVSVAITVGGLASLLLLPHFFERIRVVSGSLGFLILMTAILSTTAPAFTNGLHALKRFKTITVMNLCCALIRFLVMLVSMPFRALSGYMLGQSAPYLFQIAWSAFMMRKELLPSVKAEPFWREDGWKIVKYTMLNAISIGMTTICGAMMMMIVRQRLPEVESAAYYMISRFSELASYAGMTVIVVIFPFAAENHVQGRDSLRLILKTEAGLFAIGVVCVGGLAIFGRWILSLSPVWSGYSNYAPDMALLSASLMMSTNVAVFTTCEVAAMRFFFLWYTIPIAIVQLAFFACFTGYAFFEGILSASALSWMDSLHIGTLRNYIWLNVVANLVTIFCCAVHLGMRKIISGRSSEN